MSVNKIQESVSTLFCNHKYRLLNSYVFAWECDFYSMTKSGYSYEVEVKISRGDFFADFKKDKHVLFQNAFIKQPGYWENKGASKYNGSLICKIPIPYLTYNGHSSYIDFKSRYSMRSSEDKNKRVEDYETHSDMLNQWRRFDLRQEWVEFRAPCTNIHYVEIAKRHLPHRFYYAVPEGLIKKDEVPAYAGLLYVNTEKSMLPTIVKEAPFIHKRPLVGIDSVLLDKFYYECIEHRSAARYRNKALNV